MYCIYKTEFLNLTKQHHIVLVEFIQFLLSYHIHLSVHVIIRPSIRLSVHACMHACMHPSIRISSQLASQPADAMSCNSHIHIPLPLVLHMQ